MDAVERTNQLHTLEIGAVKLGEHGLKLRTEEHTHDRCLDDITEVMAQSDLIATQLFCFAVKMPPAHPSAEIAGRGIAVVGNLVSKMVMGISNKAALLSIFWRLMGLYPGSMTR